jgi:hypothetical protein
MPTCKNNSKKSYKGNEPSPKGLGFCASSEKDGTKMKGRDGNIWIKKSGKWIKYENPIDYHKLLYKKLYKWWFNLSTGNIIIIKKDNSIKLIKSKLKTIKAQIKDVLEQWVEFNKDPEVIAIIWSAQSLDSLTNFIEFLIKKTSKAKLNDILKLSNIPTYLLSNYKKYFVKYNFVGPKDYTLKQ